MTKTNTCQNHAKKCDKAAAAIRASLGAIFQYTRNKIKDSE